ncbi:MAG: hypothetical protein QM747_18130 [Nocardioides sp.]
MDFRRPLAVAVVASLVGLTGSWPAQAAEGVVVVPGVGALAALTTSRGLGIGGTLCARAEPAQIGHAGPVVNTSTPGTPLGSALWSLDQPEPGSAGGPVQAYSTLADFGDLQVDLVNQSTTGAQGGVVFAQALDGADVWYGVADPFSLAAGGGWHTIRADASTVFDWNEYQNKFAGEQVGGPFTGTVDQLETAVVHDDQGGVVGIGMGCDGGSFGFDAVTTGPVGGPDTTYDLETTGTSVVASNPPAAIIQAKQPLPITALLADSDGTPYQVGDVTLQAKPFGSRTWTSVGVDHWSYDFTSHANWLQVRPLVDTRYRWVYAGHDSSVSPVVPVAVAPRMTLTDRVVSVRRGTRVVFFGHILPAKPGVRLRLHHGRRVIAHTRVSSTGRFRFVIHAPQRRHHVWWVYATVRRTPGNLHGVSSAVGIKVT